MTSILKTDEIQSQNGGAVVKMQTLKHPSSGSNNLVLGSDGNVSITNTLSAGTIGSGVFPFATLNKANNKSNLNDYTVVFETETDANNILNHNSGSITFNATGTYLFFMSLYIEDNNAERRIEAFLKNGSTIYTPSRAVGYNPGSLDSDTAQQTLNSCCVLLVTSTTDTYTLFVDSDNNNTADLLDIDIQFLKMSS